MPCPGQGQAMKRCSKAVGKAGKVGRRKAAMPKRSISRKAVPGPRSRPSSHDTEIARAFRERDEALEQQAATADVLKVISSSGGKLQPVFNTMLAKAVDLCAASFGAMWLVDGKGYRNAAMHGDLPRAYVEQWRSGTLHFPKADIPLVRAIRLRKTVHTQDMRKEKAYRQGDPLAVSAANIGGIRTLVTVPLLKAGEAVGAIVIYRQEVRPFTDKQIELVQNFAAQAVIAIENTRLLNELRESLEQQTATSEVLRVISSSPGELEPVFEAILQNATRICEAEFGSMFLRDGDVFRFAAEVGTPAELAEFNRKLDRLSPTPGGVLERTMRTKQVCHSADDAAEPVPSRASRLGGARAIVGVPMLKDGELIGVIIIYRQEVRPFTEKQIELVKNFAAQAVIAIENTRLLSELRQRTDDLTESLEQQTATSEVLRVISSSPGELEPVF